MCVLVDVHCENVSFVVVVLFLSFLFFLGGEGKMIQFFFQNA